MQSPEMTESEQRALHDGLRLLARLIARHHLAQQDVADLESCAPTASAERDSIVAESEGMGS